MTTYNRVAGNLVFQTTGNTDTVTFEGLTANAATVIINGNLSVTGNAALTGNIAGDNIFNGTTTVAIPAPNGNIVLTVGGATIANVAATGAYITGEVSATGNVTCAGLVFSGGFDTAGNLSAGNIATSGNINISRDSSAGTATIRFTDTDDTVLVGQTIGAIEWYTTDLSPGARVTSAIRSTYSSITGNANVEILTSTDGAAASQKVVVLSTGNVGVGNAAPLDLFSVGGTIFGSSTISAVGNIQGGNLVTAGLASVTGNVTGGNLNTAGLASITGNITGGNIISLGVISGSASGISASGNIRGGNVNSDGVMSSTGNIFSGGNLLTQGYVSATGDLQGGNAVIVSNISGANISISTLMSGTGIGVENIVWQSTSNVISSASMANVGVLTFPALANQSYKFETILYIAPDGATTTAFSVNFPSGTCYYTLETQTTATAAWAVATSATSDTTGTTQSMTGTTNRTVRISGIFTNTANTDVTIRGQTSAANLTVQSGSYLSYTRVG